MKFVDIVDCEVSDPQKHGFSEILKIGRDIFIYNSPDKNPTTPSILAIQDKKEIVRSLRQFDLIYFPLYEADVELITSAVKKDKSFIISLSDILDRKGSDKSITLYKIRKFVKFCRAYKAKFIIASFAKSVYNIRNPREVGAIAALLDLTEPQALKSMSWR